MFILDYRMAIAAIILIPVSYVFLLQAFKATGNKYDIYFRKNKELNDVAIEYIHGIKVIKVFRQLHGQYERFSRAAKAAADCAIDWMKCTAVSFSLFSSVLPAVLLTLLPNYGYIKCYLYDYYRNGLLVVIYGDLVLRHLCKRFSAVELKLPSSSYQSFA